MKRKNTLYIIVVISMFWLGTKSNCNALTHQLTAGEEEEEEVVAFSDYASGYEGSTFIIHVLGNDWVVKESISSLVIETQPKFGIATVEGGLIKYTPNPGKLGKDELTYKVCGKTPSNCDIAKVTIEVLDYDFTPIAHDDLVFIKPGEKSEINVLANDINILDLPLKLSIIVSLSNGDSFLDDQGLLISTFRDTYRGLDSLQYRIIDKEGDSATAWVFYEIKGDVNDKIFIPQGISPNGDGLNDFFTIVELQDKGMEIKVFDVIGQMVYSEANYENNWDGRGNIGKYAGKICDNGTYYFLLKVEGHSKGFSGFLQIKK